jgi:uncharacterized Tic20 family protein
MDNPIKETILKYKIGIQRFNMNSYPLKQDQYHNWASRAHVLYLTNITFLPIISFFLQVFMYRKIRSSKNDFLIGHFRQSILASIIAGVLLICVSGLIVLFGNFESIYTWMWLILYVTCIHSLLILFGVFALVKAQAGDNYIYPLFGRFWV